MCWRKEELRLHVTETELRANSGERAHGFREPRHIVIGVFQRVIRFQSGVSLSGITGSTIRMFCVL